MFNKYRIVSQQCIVQQRFLQLNKILIQQCNESERNQPVLYDWEYVSRVKHIASKEVCEESEFNSAKCMPSIDCVEIHTILRESDKASLILVLQFRPPLNSWVLEFPRGFIDNGENAVDTAIRELQEETGYVITPSNITKISPPLCLEASMTNSCTVIITANLLCSKLSLNKHEQNLQDHEDIEVILLPLTSTTNINHNSDTPLTRVEKIIDDFHLCGRSVILDGKVYTYLLALN